MTGTTDQAPKSDISPAAIAKGAQRLRQEVGKIVIGQHQVIEQMLTALVAGGHCLLIGVPGLAKTVMAKALADVLEMQFKRVQFTPDLMPSDITGTNVLEQDTETGQKVFRFVAGPVFTNILLADEINRTPPKTQASLLEAMQEHHVTIAGEQRALPEPFFVIATQNPLEQEGTYPLPEAQLDRFMFSVIVRYPTHEEENHIVSATTQTKEVDLHRILSEPQVRAMQDQVRYLAAPPAITRYAVDLARASRPEDDTAPKMIKQYVDCGAGPRAGQYLVLAAKSRAVLNGRDKPTLEDVRAAAVPVLRHRIFTNFTALSENITSDDLIRDLLKLMPEAKDDRPIVRARVKPEADAKIDLSDQLEPIELIRRMKMVTERIRTEVQKRIIGQTDVVDLVLTSLLAGGHCLLVGVPGLAKTTLVQTLADVLHLDFKRVQFTPDLMPSDITGTDVLDTSDVTGHREFRFIPGPIFANILLADEINRTPPKTQAALLEAMQERSVTASGNTYPLDPPFFVLATQNPLEQEGTYPLPEAQLDRFMFNIWLDYPLKDEEPLIVDTTTGDNDSQPTKVIGGAEILRLQEIVCDVPVSKHVLNYVTTLVRATRPETKGSEERVRKYVHCGAGPRASQFLVLGAKARAVMHGRANVSVNDVRAVAVPVMRHRVFTNFSADAEGVTAMSLVEHLIKTLPEPPVEKEARPAKTKSKPAAKDSEDPPKRSGGLKAKRAQQVTAKCPECGTGLRVPRQALGNKVRCTQCQAVFSLDSDAAVAD